jgi:glycine cleavage system H protein
MPKYLEMTADKFTFRVATDRLYSPEGVWVLPQPDGPRVRVGLADYLQQHNGDVAFANVKGVATKLAAGGQFAEIETIKAMVDLRAPISGTIIEVNAALNMSPESINQAPYEAGWLAVIEPAAWDDERPGLLGPAAYFAVMQAQVQKDLKGL